MPPRKSGPSPNSLLPAQIIDLPNVADLTERVFDINAILTSDVHAGPEQLRRLVKDGRITLRPPPLGSPVAMTDSAFARKRGLKIGRIAWWRQKLGRLRRTEEKRASQPSRHAGELVEFKALARPASELRIEVMLRNGRSVLVPLGVPAAELAFLLNAIEEQPC